MLIGKHICMYSKSNTDISDQIWNLAADSDVYDWQVKGI